MIKNRKSWKVLLLTALMLLALCGSVVSVQASSGDNSLSTLGILTEGVEVSPEFYYSTIEYNVKVPAGTARLELDPVPSNSNASIVEITGQDLVDGKTTVEILVEAENGNRYTYYLYVEEDASAAAQTVQTEAVKETEPETEEETEPETEDPRYVRVDRNSLQEAENTISALKAETSNYRDRLDILMKILYGLIGFCVILLFVVINLTLKKKDLKSELQKYMGYGYPQENGEMQQGAGAPYQNEYGYDNANYTYDGQNADQMMGYDGYQDQNGYDMQQDAYDDRQGYPQQNYDAQQGYPQQETYDEPAGYDQQDAYQEQPETKVSKKEKKKRLSDDPDTVPKPAKARKAEKPMPKYQKPAKQADYQPNEKASENVEINMIDL